MAGKTLISYVNNNNILYLIIDVYAKDFKILIFGLPDLSIHTFDESIVHCLDINELKKALVKYRSSFIIIGCDSNQIFELDLILLNYSIDIVYVINNEKDEDEREWLYSILSNNNLILVDSEKKLMRRLCTTAVLYYHKQSLEYKNKGNNSMANLCLFNSLKALDYSTKFI